jgi:hypothetical protein
MGSRDPNFNRPETVQLPQIRPERFVFWLWGAYSCVWKLLCSTSLWRSTPVGESPHFSLG